MKAIGRFNHFAQCRPGFADHHTSKPLYRYNHAGWPLGRAEPQRWNQASCRQRTQGTQLNGPESVPVRASGRRPSGTGAGHRPAPNSGVPRRRVCRTAITYVFITATVLLPFGRRADRFISGQRCDQAVTACHFSERTLPAVNKH